jgi:hypothetical protein
MKVRMITKAKQFKSPKRFIYGLFVFLFAFASIASTFNPTPVAAQSSESCDREFYSSNDILFYDPCATTCSTSSGGNATVSSLRGKNNGEKIFNYWVDAGFSPQQAAGITGSMQHEGGFSPFRQEMSQSFPAGGWGIAQFTFGQRDAATAFVKAEIGESLFNEYYKNQYGGAALESNGFVPSGVPIEVNDKFLLSELNYLLDHIKSLEPNNIRRNAYQRDFNQTVDAATTLYNYLKTVVEAGNAATAWTYLYEFPANIKTTSMGRAKSAANILKLYSTGTTASCGGNLIAGGMTLEQAKEFMDKYNDPANEAENVKFIGGAGQGCAGGPLSNCVSLSVYFINKYTSIQGMGTGTSPGNGSTVVANIISRNPNIQNGHSPRPYAIFSTAAGSQDCDGVACGHTGIILGVDTERGKVIVGEAGCGSPKSWDGAHEYELSDFNNGSYTYAYTEGLLKGDVQ